VAEAEAGSREGESRWENGGASGTVRCWSDGCGWPQARIRESSAHYWGGCGKDLVIPRRRNWVGSEWLWPLVQLRKPGAIISSGRCN
jgi:hypothetical protein